MDAPHADRPHTYLTLPIDRLPVADPGDPLVVDVRDRSGRRLLATAEPVEFTAAGAAVARQALASLRRRFLCAANESLGDTLDRAFDIANREIHEANTWPLAAERRRFLVGATAVATDGAEMLVYLASPGQAIVVQDGHLYAFPDLASWGPSYEPVTGQRGTNPLGLSERVEPAVYRTVIAPGDAVLIGSTAVGRCLADSPQLAELAANPSWLPAAVRRMEGANHLPGCAAWMTVTSEGARDAVAESPATIASSLDPRTSIEEWLSPGLRRAIFVDRVQTRLIEMFERLVPASVPPALPLTAPCRGTYPPGAGYIRRYRGAWRGSESPFSLSHRSRGPRLPVRGRAIVAFLVLGLVLGGFYAGYDYRRARASQTAAFLSTVDAHIAATSSTLPPAAIDAQLDEADAALEAAARSGASVSLLRSRREAIAAIRDRSNNVSRLTDVTRVGTLPTEVDRASLHLLGDGERLYLVANAIYLVDPQTRTLTLLLAPGASIADLTVGPDLTAALDGDVLTVSDGRALYRLAPDGDWEASILGSSHRRTRVETTASAAYLGSFYVLDATSGVILKYPAERLGSPPQVWLKKESRPLPEDARDMAVDGSVYILTAEGEIVSYFRGYADEAFRLEVEPSLADPVALVGGPETKSLYLAETNGGEGRILCFDRHGQNVRQLLLPLSWQDGWSASAADELAHLSDIVVDETGGVIYFVGRDTIWRAAIPPAETTH